MMHRNIKTNNNTIKTRWGNETLETNSAGNKYFWNDIDFLLRTILLRVFETYFYRFHVHTARVIVFFAIERK